MKTSALRLLAILVLGAIVTGCGGAKTFSNSIRAGDTVAIAAGMQKNFTHANVEVKITVPPAVKPESWEFPYKIIPAGDVAIRGIVNLYPDPLANMIISNEIDQELTTFAQTYYDQVSGSAGDDKDMYQTTVFVDTPTDLPVCVSPDCVVTIELSNGLGDSLREPAIVDVIGSGGSPNVFQTDIFGIFMNRDMFAAMERAPHYVINFSSTDEPDTVPYAIQVDFSHEDVDAVESGKIHMVNSIGDVKNINWAGTSATSTRVILMPTKMQVMDSMLDFKIYVAGGIANLEVSPGGCIADCSVEAYDVNGDSVDGVTVSITP